MKRLSDRALQLVKDEVNRYYTPDPDTPLSQTQAVERMILLARLEALHERSGRTLTQAQLWEAVCDILPQIDRKVLKQAGRSQAEMTLVGTSLGLGAASLGAAAVLLANPLGDRTEHASRFSNPLSHAPQINVAEASPQPQANSQHKNTYETARAFGWQAALKGKNPPHSAQHWGEAAALWQQAINLLDQIPRYDEDYTIAQAKKAEYQDYLQQVQARQLNAQNLETASTPAPKFSRTASSKTQAKSLTQRPLTEVTQAPKASPTSTAQEDFLAIAKSYGWKAALASQNAPHPVEKWADISRLWQLALQNLDKVDPKHENYVEAQQIKYQYQKNLFAIRQRYRTEQDASQRLQSLEAALIEIDSSQITSSTTKQAQMQAIVSRLGTIQSNTVAHQQAQQLISATNERIQVLSNSTQVAISTDESD